MTVAILSDIHYAGPAERARGEDYELRVIANPLLRDSRTRLPAFDLVAPST